MASKKLRVIVYEDDPSLSEMLTKVLESKGHDVLSYQDPPFCPTYSGLKSECVHTRPCTDVTISAYNMPKVTGADFLKTQKALGCKLIKKPFKLSEI